jgi:GDP-L-fucose synthase
MVNNNLNKESKILVTGGRGFLGRHVVANLLGSGYQNIIAPSIKDYDLRIQSDAVGMLFREKPDAVIHLAATVGGIGENKKRPADFLYDNAMMGLEMMKISQLYGVQKFIQIGSACSYPKNVSVPFVEDDLWQGYPEETSAPYGIAKRLLLTYAQALREQHGFNAIYLIPTNMYGPGDNFNPNTSHVIPAIVSKVETAIHQGITHLCLWGSGTATRQFLYVEDCADAIVKSLTCYDGPEPINLAGGDEISIRQLAYDIGSLMGYKGQFIWDLNQPDGQPRRSLDVSRAKKVLDFTAKTSIMDGLQKTIDWYRGQK